MARNPPAPSTQNGKRRKPRRQHVAAELWAAYFDYRMVRATDSADLGRLGVRLRAAGVRRIILAGKNIKEDEQSLAATFHLVLTVPPLPSAGGWRTAVLAAD